MAVLAVSELPLFDPQSPAALLFVDFLSEYSAGSLCFIISETIDGNELLKTVPSRPHTLYVLSRYLERADLKHHPALLSQFSMFQLQNITPAVAFRYVSVWALQNSDMAFF